MWMPLAAVVMAFAPGLSVVDPGDPSEAMTVDVSESRGVYSVDARFSVSQPPAVILAVLTDYEQIPRYMPDVKKSVVLERTMSGALVEQEAVSRMLMFSKRVHLLLDVQHATATIRFRDTCGHSFTHYEGMWTVAEESGRTMVHYQLIAKPSFDVPGFFLKRLLRRDSAEMIERLQREFERRSTGVIQPIRR